MSGLKSFSKYSPVLKDAYMERLAGLKELEELRGRRVSEKIPGKEIDPTLNEKEVKEKIHTEMPLRLPISHTQFKENIGKVKIKAEPLVIIGIEHLGVIHDICPTDNPKTFRFFGDRYIATVSLEQTPPALLDMKEIPDRKELIIKLSLSVLSRMSLKSDL